MPLVLLLVLGLAFVGLARLAEAIVAGRVASQIQSSQNLRSAPTVRIAGFPFLTQALSGHYTRVDIATTGPVTQDGLTVQRVTARLDGVTAPAPEAIHGTLRELPTTSSYSTVTMTCAQLDTVLRHYGGLVGSTLRIVGVRRGHARIQGPLGLGVGVTATVRAGRIVVEPDRAGLAALPAPLASQLVNALATPIALPRLPFDLRFTSVTLEKSQVELVAVAHHTTFPLG